jgi:TIR domain
MTTTTNEALLAFFSYSRNDSEFALKLAKDLRQHGAPVWLDQLDIDPGERWDSAVEEALATCPRMLLILSPESVDSTNVMDEVSFALDEHKTVIPVLYRDCKIPFRLRRVQYIDARTDYEWGLHELLRVLGVESPPDTDAVSQRFVSEGPLAAASPTAPAGTPKGEKHEREQVDAKAPSQRLLEPAFLADASREPKPADSRRKVLIGAVVAVIGLGAGISLMTKWNPARRSPLEEKKPSELNWSMQWVNQFLQVYQGPRVEALRPYFSEIVSPYYNVPSADWAVIADDKGKFFSDFPTLRYHLVGDPGFKPTSEGGILDLDVGFDAVGKDGHQVTGTTHMTVKVIREDSGWRIAGIRERRAKP